MSLDADKLKNLRRYGPIAIAQCPACAEEGSDHRGDHLFIGNDGRFGCVLYPRESGHSHRSRIFELVGVKKEHSDPANIKIEEVKHIESIEVIEKNVLGRLGRVKSSQHVIENKKEVNIVNKEAIATIKSEVDFKTGVPNVPAGSCNYTTEELRLIQSEDKETLELIHFAKTIFEGTIVPEESLNKIGKGLTIKASETFIEPFLGTPGTAKENSIRNRKHYRSKKGIIR